MVDVPLASVGADDAGQLVGQAGRVVVDVAVGTVALVVADDELERVAGAYAGGDEVAPRLLGRCGSVGEVPQRQGQVRRDAADPDSTVSVPAIAWKSPTAVKCT
jgi:hypothetical protein